MSPSAELWLRQSDQRAAPGQQLALAAAQRPAARGDRRRALRLPPSLSAVSHGTYQRPRFKHVALLASALPHTAHHT
jgi:hypothetical protein